MVIVLSYEHDDDEDGSAPPVRVVKNGPETPHERLKWKPDAKLFAVDISKLGKKRRGAQSEPGGTVGAFTHNKK